VSVARSWVGCCTSLLYFPCSGREATQYPKGFSGSWCSDYGRPPTRRCSPEILADLRRHFPLLVTVEHL
jgi:hypothetical protein